jgi:type II secretion system protein G
MKTMNRTETLNRFGFTLMELLIVMAILIALLAFLVPTIMNSQKNASIRQTRIEIKQLEASLEQYLTDNRSYPTTEEGLFALLYLPDRNSNSVMTNSGTMTPPGMNDPNGGGLGGMATTVGPEMLSQPGVTPMTTNPMDPMNSMGMGGTGTMSTGWNQPVHNPQLYTMLRKRPDQYINSEKVLLDPWGTPYRYENNMQYYGLNRTGESNPAIWSAGPDNKIIPTMIFKTGTFRKPKQKLPNNSNAYK